jgi:ribonucleoside-diphosphate reductase beta chain
MPHTSSSEQDFVSIVSARRMIDGPSDKLRSVSSVKYPWTAEIWDTMLSNNWDPNQVGLTRDQVQFEELKAGQQVAIKRGLAFLSNLDSIQVDNLAANVGTLITDPNVRECIYRQQFEEVVHVKAYSTIVESLFPSDPMSIYDMHAKVPQLGQKNDYIIAKSEEVTKDPTPVNKVKAIVSNIALEGIFFFTGFVTFYAVGRQTGKMGGAIDQIKYIQRDETVHLQLFQNIYLTVKNERSELFTKENLREYQGILQAAAELEIEWGKFLISDGVPGLTDKIMTDYIRFRTNLVSSAIGLGLVFPQTRNPIEWVDQYAEINGSQKNFFETKPMTYSETQPKFTPRKDRLVVTSNGAERIRL